MKNFVKFRDSVDLVPLEVSQEIIDYYNDAIKNNIEKVKPLQIKVAATHSGKVTRNNGFYLPNKMKEGTKTFISEYTKPILVHHQSEEDPIGRVIDAKYIDISRKSNYSFLNSIDKFDNFIDGSLEIEDSVNFANSHIINDIKIVNDSSYEGLGYIELTINVVDPAAIVKVLDGRYFTGSVGASTDQAVCSICKKDWAKKGPCEEHRPGKVYDGKKCVLIAGNLNYEEWSFVNSPADRHSRVIEINVNGIQDFVTIDNFEILLIEDKLRSKEDKLMTLEQMIEFVKKLNKFTITEDQIKDMFENNPDISEEGLVELLEKNEENLNTKENTEILDEVEEFFGDSYQELIENDENGKLYAEMLYSLLDNINSEEEKTKIIKEINDAKLTAKQRKELPESSFCGPNRSFPVPDCTHYTAAKRLIGKYKGPGNKDSILSCIERKGKRMGCTEEKEEKSMNDFFVKNLTVESFDKYDDKDVINLIDVLSNVAKEREVDCGCEKNYESEIKTLKDEIDSLNNLLADTILETRELYKKYISDLNKISKKEINEEELVEKDIKDLSSIIDNLKENIDLEKINDFLNSGLSNNPEEVVEDPTLIQNNSSLVVDNKNTKISDNEKKQLKLQWLKIRTSQGQKIADTWLADICKTLNIEINEVNI